MIRSQQHSHTHLKMLSIKNNIYKIDESGPNLFRLALEPVRSGPSDHYPPYLEVLYPFPRPSWARTVCGNHIAGIRNRDVKRRIGNSTCDTHTHTPQSMGGCNCRSRICVAYLYLLWAIHVNTTFQSQQNTAQLRACTTEQIYWHRTNTNAPCTCECVCVCMFSACAILARIVNYMTTRDVASLLDQVNAYAPTYTLQQSHIYDRYKDTKPLINCHTK